MGKHQNDLDARARLALADGRRQAVLHPQLRRPPIAQAIAGLQERLVREGLDACGVELEELERAMNGGAS